RRGSVAEGGAKGEPEAGFPAPPQANYSKIPLRCQLFYKVIYYKLPRSGLTRDRIISARGRAGMAKLRPAHCHQTNKFNGFAWYWQRAWPAPSARESGPGRLKGAGRPDPL